YQPVGRGGWLPPATWSTDGAWLTFSVESWDEADRGLWATAADGSRELRLNPLSQSPVTWSPPGDEPWANGRTLLLTPDYWEDEPEVFLVYRDSWRQAPLAMRDRAVVDWRRPPWRPKRQKGTYYACASFRYRGIAGTSIEINTSIV
ncbi:MAG: hypothetical protein JSW55_08175, partial [Chloroflexota bacterium]